MSDSSFSPWFTLHCDPMVKSCLMGELFVILLYLYRKFFSPFLVTKQYLCIRRERRTAWFSQVIQITQYSSTAIHCMAKKGALLCLCNTVLTCLSLQIHEILLSGTQSLLHEIQKNERIHFLSCCPPNIKIPHAVWQVHVLSVTILLVFIYSCYAL